MSIVKNSIATPFSYGSRVLRKVLAPSACRSVGTVVRVRTTEPVVALTFDDGPDPCYTPLLLEALSAYQAKATFFMTGEAAARHPELVRQVAHAGHGIGNHSWDHPSMPLLSCKERRLQIEKCASALAPYGDARLFRPPYGEQTLASAWQARRLGYRLVMFDISTDDWCGADATVICRQIETRLRPGSIVVLHDHLSDALERAYFNRQPVIDAVRLLLEHVGRQFRFLTVPELLRCGTAEMELWDKKPDLPLLNGLLREEGIARRYSKPNGREKFGGLVERVLGIESR